MVLSTDPGERGLGLGGLGDLLDTDVSRMGRPSLVGGRIPPRDWFPQTQAERAACFTLVIDLVEELLASPEPLVGAAWAYFQSHLRVLLAWGQLDRLQLMLQRQPIPEPRLGAWLEEIDNFLAYEAGIESEDDSRPTPKEHRDYCDRVRAWQASLLPGDFRGRLRGIVGKDLWHHSIREDIQKQDSEIAPLVTEVFSNPLLLESNLDYLMSPEARSASTFGVLLGRKDAAGWFLDWILTPSRESHSSVLLRGYVTGLLNTSLEQIDRISRLLDVLEQDDPAIAAEIIAAAIELTDAAARLGRMVQAGKLPPAYMQYLHYGSILHTMSSTEFAMALKILTPPRCTRSTG